MKINFRRLITRYILCALILLLSACTPYKPFIAPGFTGASLDKGGLAIFPVMIAGGSQNVPGIQSYVHTASGELMSAIKTTFPSLRIIGPDQVSALLAQNDLVEDFAKLRETYAITGILDVKLAKKIVKPLHVKYFMLPSLDALYAPSSSTFSTAKAQMSTKIYNVDSAEVVFEAVQGGDATSILGGPPYSDAIQNATKKLVHTLIIVYGQK